MFNNKHFFDTPTASKFASTTSVTTQTNGFLLDGVHIFRACLRSVAPKVPGSAVRKANGTGTTLGTSYNLSVLAMASPASAICDRLAMCTNTIPYSENLVLPSRNLAASRAQRDYRGFLVTDQNIRTFTNPSPKPDAKTSESLSPPHYSCFRYMRSNRNSPAQDRIDHGAYPVPNSKGCGQLVK